MERGNGHPSWYNHYIAQGNERLTHPGTVLIPRAIYNLLPISTFKPMNNSSPVPTLDRRWPAIPAVIIVLIVATAALAFLSLARPPFSQIADNRQILYGYAAQLRSGNGLVFNPGERVLLIAAPADMLLLAIFGSFFAPNAIAQAAEWLFVAALVVGALSLYHIARRAGLSITAASLIAILYAVAWPLWLGVGTALPVMTGLSLLALDLALDARWRLAGLVTCVAILCSPEALFLAVPLLFLAANRQAGRRYGLAVLAPLVLAALALRLYFGPALWDGLLILRPSPSTLDSLLPWLLSIPALGLAVYGWYRQRMAAAGEINPALGVAGAWAALHLLVVGGLLRVPTGWQYAPVVGPVLLLAAAGLQNVNLSLRRAGYVILVVLFLASTAGIFGPAKEPARQSLPGDPLSIGVMSTSQALNIRHDTKPVIVAFDGQLQPDLKAMIEHGDIQSMLIRYAPEILITSDSGRIPAKALTQSSWARLDYRPIDRSGTYLRYTSIGNFAERQVQVAYGLDIRLVGMALDQESLRPGQLLRVRLDWEFIRPATKPITVDLWLESGEYVLAHTTDEYAPSMFEAGRWSTYHTLTLSPDAWPGPVTLTAGVIVSDGIINRAPIASLDVTAR